eukprot:comp17147_c0_seq1/m.28457 comp17147_c0_seq1/g.28457  ORF comp17147_c0_seq1/g.28457 comp17147_c0_seq1/m.28457 type:complete len:423 (-) comp17147_c0_seq1:30-1298(-)
MSLNLYSTLSTTASGAASFRALAGLDEADSPRFPGRNETSYLTTIANRAVTRRPELRPGEIQPEGASPRRHFEYRREVVKEKIEKSTPRELHRTLVNAPMFSLTTADVDGATPASHSFTSSRHVNSLDPVYQLPSHVAKPVTPPRFLRDTFEIVGERKKRRELAPHDDLFHVFPNKPKHPIAGRGIVGAADLDHDPREGKSFFRASQHHVRNPLSPRYSAIGIKGEYGDVPLSHPPHYRERVNMPMFSLTTKDVNEVDHLLEPEKSMLSGKHGTRRELRKINFIQDIDGAAPGSTWYAQMQKKERAEAELLARRPTPEPIRREIQKAIARQKEQQANGTATGGAKSIHKKSLALLEKQEAAAPAAGPGNPVQPRWWPRDAKPGPLPFMEPVKEQMNPRLQRTVRAQAAPQRAADIDMVRALQ